MAAEPPAEEFVQITKKDFDRIMAAIPVAETVEEKFSKVFGTIGNVKNEVLQRISAGVPVPDEALSKLRDEYPELAELITPIVTHRGSGTAQAATMDPEAIKAAVKSELERQLVAEVDALHPGWVDIIGKPDDADNPYRQWVAKQPEAYRKRLNDSFSPTVIADSLDRFKASQTAPEPTPTPRPTVVRQNRFRDAVQPRGSGQAPPPQQPSAEQEMSAGFRRASTG